MNSSIRPWMVPAAAGVMAGVALILGAAEADANGFFGETTAAWVQAVGSISAIVAAIIIDRGTARRAAAAKLAEARAANDARKAAVERCSRVLEDASDMFLDSDFGSGRSFTIGAKMFRRWDSARTTLAHYATRGSDDDPTIIVIMTEAIDLFDGALAKLRHRSVMSLAQAESFQTDCQGWAEAIRKMVTEHEEAAS